MAVSKAQELGIKTFCIPTVGMPVVHWQHMLRL